MMEVIRIYFIFSREFPSLLLWYKIQSLLLRFCFSYEKMENKLRAHPGPSLPDLPLKSDVPAILKRSTYLRGLRPTREAPNPPKFLWNAEPKDNLRDRIKKSKRTGENPESKLSRSKKMDKNWREDGCLPRKSFQPKRRILERNSEGELLIDTREIVSLHGLRAIVATRKIPLVRTATISPRSSRATTSIP